jgi:hypothetical protein
MIHEKLYERVSMAYTDTGEQPNERLQIFDDPRETVENAIKVLEYAKRNLEVIEWQTHYHFGEAVHREIMRNPGDTYGMGGDRLDLTRYQTRIGVRIYQLFRDHTYALTKLSGINSRDIILVPKKRFEDTLRALNRDFPPTPIPEDDGDFEFEF